ncbi:cytosolic Fe-S cluster assembly factor NAR1 [Tremella mesenterica]|uniref:Cytosolic Fe-S cluster assembly factor NAR1 n=1 Tax=Tremella mesenterica TaxID=5217 RepID=A0A4Q1BJB7_TREME|nr:cytosolic Fe-S cluster assembly factor NAR1 [Tremella mesenterica]
MTFSGALTITDLDDFLTPSQACIIPVRNAKPVKAGNGDTDIHIDANNNYYEVSTYSLSDVKGVNGAESSKTALEKAEINLNDCLACSGCITSTESLLITMQSHKEVLEFIAQRCSSSSSHALETRTPVLSISPQTLASLSAAYGAKHNREPIPLLVLLRRIRTLLDLKKHGGWKVWDTTFARHVSLKESIQEFEERSENAKGKGVAKPSLPMLASACPGWVCYAEKAQGDMLPLLSATRSSQGVMGALVKQWWGQKMSLEPSQIYHVTAMPCYDKKLEASRSDFYSSVHNTRDVDCVLTTGELDLLLQELGFDPYEPVPNDHLPSSPLSTISTAQLPWPELLNHPGSSSDSYLSTIISHISNIHPNPTQLTVRKVRESDDNTEYFLEDTVTGDVIFKGARCYGFRNLQNLVRRVGKETGIGKAGGRAGKLSAAVAARRRKARIGTGEIGTPITPTTDGSDVENIFAALGRDSKKLDFVEVMACPGGCANGGGQMKAVIPSTEKDEEGYERPMEVDGVASKPPAEDEMRWRWSTKDWVAKVEAVYWNGLPTPPPSPQLRPQEGMIGQTGKQWEDERLKEADRLTASIAREMCGDERENRYQFLRTRFRKVEGDVLKGGVSHEAVRW